MKTQKFKNLTNQMFNRRRSDADQLIKIPTINIHFVDPTKNNQTKVKTLSFKEENSDFSGSNTNFS